MSDSLYRQSVPVQFYTTASYPCSYLDDQDARSQVAAPSDLIDARRYGQLLLEGFRRSGQFVYRPVCDNCQACVPVRLLVDQFKPDRSQQRATKKHGDLKVRLLGLKFTGEHFELYQSYQAARHAGGGMDKDDREQYENFILKSNVASFLAEFREEGVLRMVSLIDQVDDGLSSAYTFFDPDVAGASYGVYNVVWQAGLARQLGMPYVYLGYWIQACQKMAYKSRYQPLEGYIEADWRLLNDRLTTD